MADIDNSSLQDVLWISNPSLALFQGGKASLTWSESSKVHRDLFQPERWYHNAVAVVSETNTLSPMSLLVSLFFGFHFLCPASSIALGARRKHTAEFDSVASGVWKGWPWNVLCLFSAMGANPN